MLAVEALILCGLMGEIGSRGPGKIRKNSSSRFPNAHMVHSFSTYSHHAPIIFNMHRKSNNKTSRLTDNEAGTVHVLDLFDSKLSELMS